MKKRSFAIKGHRTSVALEPEFWAALERSASESGDSLAALVARVDAERAGRAGAPSLASALRVFALTQARN